MPRKTIAGLEKELEEVKTELARARETAKLQNDRINDLQAQLQGRVEDSPFFRTQLESFATIQTELTTTKISLDTQTKELKAAWRRESDLERMLAEAQEENARLKAELAAAAEKARIDSKLTAEVEVMRKCFDDMMQAIDQPAESEDMTVIAGKTGIITIAKHDRRGGKRKIDLETRQYARELRKIKTWDGKPVNSIKSISDIVGLSKTQTFAVLQEPDIPGRWFSEDSNGSRTYYDDYITAAHSKRPIHFQPDHQPNE